MRYDFGNISLYLFNPDKNSEQKIKNQNKGQVNYKISAPANSQKHCQIRRSIRPDNYKPCPNPKQNPEYKLFYCKLFFEILGRYPADDKDNNYKEKYFDKHNKNLNQ